MRADQFDSHRSVNQREVDLVTWLDRERVTKILGNDDLALGADDVSHTSSITLVDQSSCAISILFTLLITPPQSAREHRATVPASHPET